MLRFAPGRSRYLGLALACALLAGCVSQTTTQVTAAATPAFRLAQKPPPALAQGDFCQPPHGPDRTFAPGRPEHIERPALPDRARQDHVGGCAGVMFHLTPSGHTADLRVVAEYPLNYGFAESARRRLADATFSPALAGPRWYYVTEIWVIR